MRISRDQLICGVPAFDLRAALKKLSDGWTLTYLAGLLKVPKRAAKVILEDLVAEGFVEPDPRPGRECYRVTIKGGALAGASALRPIQRQKATQLLEEVVARAKEINADDRELYRVSKLWVFGSYLTEVEELGDLDIAVELTRKDDEWPQMPDGEWRYSEVVPPPRGWSRSHLAILGWPIESVTRRLKGQRRHLSLHPHTDRILETAHKQEVFAA